MLQEIADSIYDEYVDAFNEYLKVQAPKICWEYIGQLGSEIFNKEFALTGPVIYKTSIIQAIRNAYFCRGSAPKIYKMLEGRDMPEPILDYGCGVGFFMKFLERQGYSDVYGWDISQPQREILELVGIPVWDREDGIQEFGTVICINMLEHLEDPRPLLQDLRRLGRRVYANCDMAEQEAHICPQSIRREVNMDLVARGENLQ